MYFNWSVVSQIFTAVIRFCSLRRCLLSWWYKCGLPLRKRFADDYHSHYDDVIMGAIASLITSLTIVYSTVYSDADQRKHQSSASLAFVWGIHRGPVNSSHKWPVTRKMFPFDDVIMVKIIREAPSSLFTICNTWWVRFRIGKNNQKTKRGLRIMTNIKYNAHREPSFN